MSTVPLYTPALCIRVEGARCRGLIDGQIMVELSPRSVGSTLWYRGTLLVRKRTPLGPYRRPMHRAGVYISFHGP
jgi:hypothetical protein